MQAMPSWSIEWKPNDNSNELEEAPNHSGISNENHLPKSNKRNKKLAAVCQHVRIMVVGRSGSGKTTLIRLVVGESGLNSMSNGTTSIADINVEWYHQDPNFTDLQFIFHDSNGINVEGCSRLQEIEAFLDVHQKSEDPSQRIQLVWYVFSAADTRLADDGGLLEMLGTRYPMLPVLLVMTFNDYGKAVKKNIDSPNSGFEMLLRRIVNPNKRDHARDMMVRLGIDAEETEDGSGQSNLLQILMEHTKKMIRVEPILDLEIDQVSNIDAEQRVDDPMVRLNKDVEHTKDGSIQEKLIRGYTDSPQEGPKTGHVGNDQLTNDTMRNLSNNVEDRSPQAQLDSQETKDTTPVQSIVEAPNYQLEEDSIHGANDLPRKDLETGASNIDAEQCAKDTTGRSSNDVEQRKNMTLVQLISQYMQKLRQTSWASSCCMPRSKRHRAPGTINSSESTTADSTQTESRLRNIIALFCPGWCSNSNNNDKNS